MSKETKILLQISVGILLISNLMGCATFGSRDLECQGLRGQVKLLEYKLAQKDKEIQKLKMALKNKVSKTSAHTTKNTTKKSVTTKKKEISPTVKQIQIALKNAGYNPGPIDGKMGNRTKLAVRTFQRENALGVDGAVGKQTWKLLRQYLY